MLGYMRFLLIATYYGEIGIKKIHVQIRPRGRIFIYYIPVTKKFSDAKVKRQGYKHALFRGGGGTFVWGYFSKIP